MFDLDQIVNSAIGSLLVALLFIGTVPLWWEWAKTLLAAERLRERAMPLLFLCFVLGLVWVMVSFWPSRPVLKPKPTNPNMAEAEIQSILNECEMKAIEVSTQLQGTGLGAEMERARKQARYERLCLSENGIELVPDTSQEDDKEVD